MDSKPTNVIRAARQRKGLTQQQLGDKLGYTKQSVSDWECGRSDPPPRAAIALTRLLPGLKFEHIYATEQGRAAA
jgi:DNA-binding XRE family transcriptional regulator